MNTAGMDAVVVAVDQGTSSTKAAAMDGAGALVASATVPVGQSSPRPGWVEQSPGEILDSVLRAVGEVLDRCEAPVAAVALSNQRESALAWDTATGEPLGPLLGWQDRRTVDRAKTVAARGASALVRERSGLPLDPMFSALKLGWLLDEVDADRSRARAGAITVGTLDAWLVQRLTGDRRIEVGNASRTQLLGIRTADWDDDLLDVFDVPRAALPPVVASDSPTSVVHGAGPRLAGVRVRGVLGDSHSALFAHGVRRPGRVKATFGTGSSIMGLSAGAVPPGRGVVETIAWGIGGDAAGATGLAPAFEGNILSVGSTLVWAAEALGCTTDELDRLARSVPDNAGVYLVPAFSGLGAPWWDDDARSVLTGFGPGNGRAHLARAAFESIPLQVEDVLQCADLVGGARVEEVLADGGPTRNDWLMQQQADLSGRRVERSDVAELSVSGVAHLAGLGAGLWDADALAALPRPRTTFQPAAERTGTDDIRREWATALALSRSVPRGPTTTHRTEPTR